MKVRELGDKGVPRVGGRAGYFTSFYDDIGTLEGQNYLTTKQRQEKEMRDMMNLRDLSEMMKDDSMGKIAQKLDMNVEEVLDMLENAEHNGEMPDVLGVKKIKAEDARHNFAPLPGETATP